MIVFTFEDLEFLSLKGGQGHDLRKHFQGTLLKIIGERLEHFNKDIDGCREEVDELLDKQIDLTEKTFTRTTEAKYEAIEGEIAEAERRRDAVLADLHDFLAILWILARTAYPYRNWSDSAIESILARRRERLSKTGVVERKETRKVGRPATKLHALAARMRAEIESGKITRDELQNIPIKQLSYRFGAHRDTAIRARRIVLEDQGEQAGVIAEELESERVGNSVIEFPSSKSVTSE